jgi:hypothetical protein
MYSRSRWRQRRQRSPGLDGPAAEEQVYDQTKCGDSSFRMAKCKQHSLSAEAMSPSPSENRRESLEEMEGITTEDMLPLPELVDSTPYLQSCHIVAISKFLRDATIVPNCIPAE